MTDNVTQPGDRIKAQIVLHEELAKATREGRELAKKLDNPERAPNPVPDKHVRDMTITEMESFERWAGISPSSAERARRQRVRARAAEMDQRI